MSHSRGDDALSMARPGPARPNQVQPGQGARASKDKLGPARSSKCARTSRLGWDQPGATRSNQEQPGWARSRPQDGPGRARTRARMSQHDSIISLPPKMYRRSTGRTGCVDMGQSKKSILNRHWNRFVWTESICVDSDGIGWIADLSSDLSVVFRSASDMGLDVL